MFESPKKIVDRWVGEEPVSLHGGVINTLSYTFRVVDCVITLEQKNIALNFLDNYASHWNEVEQKITEKLSMKDINSRLLIYVPAVVGNIEYEYMVGYEFKKASSLYCGFFAYRDGSLEYIHVDDY